MTAVVTNHFKTTLLGETSKKMFNIALDKWKKCWGMPKTLEWIIQHPVQAMKCLRAAEGIKATPMNHHRFISAVLAYLKHEAPDNDAFLVWKKIQDANSEPLKEHRLSGKPTALQADKIQLWERILEVRDELELGETKLLLAFYTYINPVRADYYDCMIYKNEKEVDHDLGVQNYIILDDKPRVVMGDYKTSKHYGVLTLPMPEELVAILKAFLKANPKRVWLFEKIHDTESTIAEPFDRAYFSMWANRRLRKAFNAPMTLTAIRHSFTSQLDYNQSIALLNTIAKTMGHSVDTQRKYKWDEADKKNTVVPE